MLPATRRSVSRQHIADSAAMAGGYSIGSRESVTTRPLQETTLPVPAELGIDSSSQAILYQDQSRAQGLRAAFEALPPPTGWK
ncbi:hypothetical protein M8818_006680 [Zalaria obscura]|uniref:Uncharacterized protein n=1 Tax=Zalaria obscura TaxID=2024903 RepID=A0ACC3S5J8_9PEZI